MEKNYLSIKNKQTKTNVEVRVLARVPRLLVGSGTPAWMVARIGKIPAGLGVWLVIPDFGGTFCRGGGGRKSGCVGAKEMEAAPFEFA